LSRRDTRIAQVRPPEVPPDLPGDGGDRVAQEVVAEAGVEPFEGVQQPDTADLFEIGEWFTSAGVARAILRASGR
jgi:hypothetical protein